MVKGGLGYGSSRLQSVAVDGMDGAARPHDLCSPHQTAVGVSVKSSQLLAPLYSAVSENRLSGLPDVLIERFDIDHRLPLTKGIVSPMIRRMTSVGVLTA